MNRLLQMAATTKMRPLEKFEANCTVLLVTSEQQEKQNQQPDQQQQCDISLSAFSDIYNEYLSDHSEIETASTSDTDSSSSTTSISNQTSIIKNKEIYERSIHQKNTPDIRNNLHNNQLFGVQLEVNFLLLEAERRKLKILQQELNLSLDECDKFECKKKNQSQCHELLLTISRIQSQHNLLEKELAEHTIDILKYSNIRIIEKNNRNQPAIGLKQNSKTRVQTYDAKLFSQSNRHKTNKSMDEEILKTVQAVLGKNIEIVDCQKTKTVQEEEILLINGKPIKLEGSDGAAIKKALMTGQLPSCELLNQILYQAGILRQPVHLETTLSVKSSLTTTEEIRVARNGIILDERSLETKEDNYYTSECTEVWEPIGKVTTSIKNSNGVTDDYCLPSADENLTFIKRNKTSSSTQIPPMRQNSVCTNDSIYSSSASSSSRPTSDLSVNISNSDMNLYDNIQSYLINHHGHSNNNNNMHSSTSIDPKLNQSLSCDSGHHDYSLTSTTVNDDEYIIPSTATQSSIATQSSFNGTESNKTANCSAASIDEIDFQRCRINGEPLLIKLKPQHYLPTIFGTVASDQSPKDISSRRGHPQTVSGHQVISSSDEFDSDENTLIYRDGNLSSATLEALIQHMVPTNDYYPDRSYIFAFLLSSRLFIKPYQLLSKIWDLSQQQQNLKSFIQQKLAQNNPKLSRFSQFLIQLLAEWVDTFPYDFRDERLMSQIKEITQTSIQINPSLRTEVSQLLQNLLSKLQELETYEEHLEKLNQQTSNGKDECDSTNKSPNNANGLQQQTSVHSNHSHKSNSSSSSLVVSTLSHQSDISEICSSPLLLAHQLTHIELERLSHIGPEEFVQAFTKEHPSIETSFKDLKKTRNLESYVTWFNRLSYLVATDVIKHPKKKQRARIIEFWIETARESFNIGNFNSLMAIIAGLNMSPISRLKKTWAKIQSAKFSILEHQMDSSSNFSSYRSTLKAAMWRSAGATDERERIVIPFFSLLVKDLYFLNEGCSNKLPCGHINFEKFWQLAKQVTEFMAWKQVTCPFEKNEKLINYLQTTSILNECTLALASFECEPPENNHEKDHYKFLKNEVHK